MMIGGRELGFIPVNTLGSYKEPTIMSNLLRTKLIKAQEGHKAVVYKGKIFVFGGKDENGIKLNSVEMLPAYKNTFVMMAPMKVARSHFACCRVGNLVYVMGGWSDTGKTDTVEIYNLDMDVWTEG